MQAIVQPRDGLLAPPRSPPRPAACTDRDAPRPVPVPDQERAADAGRPALQSRGGPAVCRSGSAVDPDDPAEPGIPDLARLARYVYKTMQRHEEVCPFENPFRDTAALRARDRGEGRSDDARGPGARRPRGRRRPGKHGPRRGAVAARAHGLRGVPRAAPPGGGDGPLAGGRAATSPSTASAGRRRAGPRRDLGSFGRPRCCSRRRVVGAAGRAPLLLDDFSRPDGRSALGTAWRAFTDQVMGGVSTQSVGRETVEGSGGPAPARRGSPRQQRRLHPGGARPRRTSRRQPGLRGPRPACPWQRRGCNAVHLRSRDTRLPWQYYEAAFTARPQWSELELPFDDFAPQALRTPLDRRALLSVGIVASKRAFQADVAVSRIELY